MTTFEKSSFLYLHCVFIHSLIFFLFIVLINKKRKKMKIVSKIVIKYLSKYYSNITRNENKYLRSHASNHGGSYPYHNALCMHEHDIC